MSECSGARKGPVLVQVCALHHLRSRVIFDTILFMIGRTKKLRARFYQTASGRKPVREWLLEIDEADRRIIGYDVQTVEFGWPIGMPVCRPLGSGLWEIRSNLSRGTIGRIIFCIRHDEMVLLHGFVKKTHKTPPQDIELAIKRRNELE